MGLIQNDFERFHNHASEAITYFFRLILSMFIMLFDSLYRLTLALREYTYSDIKAPFRIHADAKELCERINSIPLGYCSDLYLNGTWKEFWDAEPFNFGNEMLQEELILSDKPAKGKIKVWKAANAL